MWNSKSHKNSEEVSLLGKMFSVSRRRNRKDCAISHNPDTLSWMKSSEDQSFKAMESREGTSCFISILSDVAASFKSVLSWHANKIWLLKLKIGVFFSFWCSLLWGNILGKCIQSCVWCGVPLDYDAFSLADAAWSPSDKMLLEDHRNLPYW